jgi:hypothetical protein
MNTKYWCLILTSVFIGIFLWDHVGRLSGWTFRPTIALENVSIISSNGCELLGRFLALSTHFVINLVRNMYLNLGNILVGLLNCIGYCFEKFFELVGMAIEIIVSKQTLINALEEILRTLFGMFSQIFWIVISPFRICFGWFSYINSITDLFALTTLQMFSLAIGFMFFIFVVNLMVLCGCDA